MVAEAAAVAPTAAAAAATAEQQPQPEKKKESLLHRVVTHVRLVAISVDNDARLVARELRQLPAVRSALNATVLQKAVRHVLGTSALANELVTLLDAVPTQAMDVDGDEAPLPTVHSSLPVELYMQLLVVLVLHDNKMKESAVRQVTLLLERARALPPRTMEALLCKVVYFFAVVQESVGQLAAQHDLLFQLYRTSVLRHEEAMQSTLINTILRVFIAQKQYDQADKFVRSTVFPAGAPSVQHARYQYYLGRINAVQLKYPEAYVNLMHAIRKAPQSGALGFRIVAHKWLVLVDLLMGDVPAKELFLQSGLQQALRPYFALTKAVRLGDLDAFEAALAEHQTRFIADDALTFVQRLRHNVIKAGLRKISMAYSSISFDDIARKLGLENERVAEGVVAKSIADGVISATIDHDRRAVVSKEVGDVYSTEQPLAAYHKRVETCHELYTQAVQAMTFPEKAEDSLAALRSMRDRLQEEMALAEDDSDVDDDDDDDMI